MSWPLLRLQTAHHSSVCADYPIAKDVAEGVKATDEAEKNRDSNLDKTPATKIDKSERDKKFQGASYSSTRLASSGIIKGVGKPKGVSMLEPYVMEINSASSSSDSFVLGSSALDEMLMREEVY
ncbi:hypothetical protein AMTR_s00011p00015460 [Amborella trichopoda]|uniref:Uncharacterized protein n=1 Tax=Amborella trichopoda TaxID=13333 RepID=W1NFI6_AMBTC|nr:hypothetical protein AMTR_s00011p00015460 [Amborella trichopoda]